MIALAVDTSHTQGSLALAQIHNHKVEDLHVCRWQKQAMHSEACTLELERLLKKMRMPIQQLEVLCVNHGPGSFTGLRVGINLAKTLAYALNLKVATYSTLELQATHQLQNGEQALACMKAIQNFHYAQAFSKTGDTVTALSEPTSTDSPSALAKSLSCTKVLSEHPPSAQELVERLALDHALRPLFAWHQVQPLYIRGREADEKFKKGWLRPVQST